MTTRMLIDARHREETRVAVVKGNRIEEFDFESAEHKQLKGNIYLAKVTRVEPSLQAAFVDYGGNRHGFLAFSEIHPDYYQIPKEDREALLAEEAEHAAEEAALRAEEDVEELEGDVADVAAPDHDTHEDEEDSHEDAEEDAPRNRKGRRDNDAADDLKRKRMALRRRYKIQDVIRRRQVLLVQVVKEERGNKGAALTTYLSLAGRYCVLMPNTSHGGGISRKISNATDRKRLKSIVSEMQLPSTMGCIVRTAGLSRTKTEIKRDFDYLARLWDEIRENTLKASAPEIIHSDSDLIKRAIRDIYNRDIEEVLVEGEDGYRAAKAFMKLLMPSHARRVKAYADAVSLFQRYGVEDQLGAMYHPVVQLKSGGYLVINPTEALVSIDINSGRSTREHGIEQTAVATNLEAAREIARQLRLRDMAGLVVIDFIDMENNSNIRKVEKAMKEALKNDRARIQVGRISGFGLMEMSRQRLRTGVLEASTRQCPHCEGTGLVRTASSSGLSALRMLEEEAARGRGSQLTLRASQEAAFYVLNNKRSELAEIEQRYGVSINILSDGELEGARMSVEASGPKPANMPRFEPIIDEDDDILEEEIDEQDEEEEEAPEQADRDEDRSGRRRRRRRNRRGRRGDEPRSEEAGESLEEGEESGAEAAAEEGISDSEGEGEGDREGRRRGRRGRRGGRRRRGGDRVAEAGAETAPVEDDGEASSEAETESPVEVEAEPVEAGAALESPAEQPKKTRRRPRARKQDVSEGEGTPADNASEAESEAGVETVAEEKPKRTRRKKAAPKADAEAPATAEQAEGRSEEANEAPAKPKRRTRKAKVADEPVGEAELAVASPESSAAPAAEEPAPAAPEATSQEEAEAADDREAANDANGNASDDAPPRRGWWQRTFGA